jgi:hypothetical protein
MTADINDIQQTGISSDFKIPTPQAPRYYQTRLRFKAFMGKS